MEAEAIWHLGRNKEAESIYTQALPIKEQALGASHPSVARMLGNLGLIYLDEGRYRDAEGAFRRSLAVLEHAPGEEADVARTLDNFANAYEAQGRYPEAEDLFKRSLPIEERLYGTSHSSVADTLHNLSRVYVSQGRYQDAEGLLKRALSIRNRAPGGNDPQLDVLERLPPRRCLRGRSHFDGTVS
jgi:tetratricopeptide (TPR) repeat protein